MRAESLKGVRFIVASRKDADMRRRGRVPPAAVIIMSHVATKPLVAVSTNSRKVKASELLIKYLEITELINDNN